MTTQLPTSILVMYQADADGSFVTPNECAAKARLPEGISLHSVTERAGEFHVVIWDGYFICGGIGPTVMAATRDAIGLAREVP